MPIISRPPPSRAGLTRSWISSSHQGLRGGATRCHPFHITSASTETSRRVRPPSCRHANLGASSPPARKALVPPFAPSLPSAPRSCVVLGIHPAQVCRFPIWVTRRWDQSFTSRPEEPISRKRLNRKWSTRPYPPLAIRAQPTRVKSRLARPPALAVSSRTSSPPSSALGSPCASRSKVRRGGLSIRSAR